MIEYIRDRVEEAVALLATIITIMLGLFAVLLFTPYPWIALIVYIVISNI